MFATSPTVASDGAGTWVAAWESREDAGGVGTDVDIYFARSTDGGLTWSAGTTLNTNAASDAGDDAQPFVAYDPSGDWLAIWVSDDDLGGTIGTDFDLLIARSSDGGLTWSAPAPLNGNAATDVGDDGGATLALVNAFIPDGAHAATNGSGDWVVLWGSSDDLGGTIGTDTDVLVARSGDAGLTWSPPAPVDPGAGADAATDTAPSVATDGAGNWVAAWTGGLLPGGPIKAATSSNGGLTWSAPATLAVPGGTEGVTVATDGTTWAALWNTDHLLEMAGSTDAGATWSAAESIPGAFAEFTLGGGGPGLVTDGAGSWIGVWATDDPLTSLGVASLGDDMDVLAFRGSICGDGAIGGGETCEDANALPGDGCDEVCRVEPCYTCTGLPSSCAIGLRSGCKTTTVPGGSKLIVKVKAPVTGDSVKWKWTRGEQTGALDFGDVLANDGLGLCIFDDSGGPATLLVGAAAPAGGTCLGKPCWRVRGIPYGSRKLIYKDAERTPTGILKVSFKPGDAGKSKAAVGAKGDTLLDPPLPFGTTTRVQLHASTGACWEATFSGNVLRNDATQFNGLSD